MTQDQTSTEAATPSNDEVQKMLGQAIVTGLIALILFALSFFYYVWKQNHELSDALIRMEQQSKSAQNFDHFYNGFINDLAAYSQQHPEVLQMLTQSGINVQQSGGGAAHQELPPLPPPPAQ